MNWYILLAAVGVIGLVWCLIPVFTAFIFNIGTATGIAVFGLMSAWGLWPEKCNALFGRLPALMRWILIALAALIAALTVLISVKMVMACNDKPSENSTVIVLGCGVYGEQPSLMLSERLEAAEAYLRKNPGSSAILSGGQGRGENISEAEAMHRWMVRRGIDPSRLYKEDRSSSTRENIAYSLEIIRANNLSEEIAVASNEFHLLRAHMIAEEAGLHVTSLPGHTAWWLFAVNYIRELYGVIYQAVL